MLKTMQGHSQLCLKHKNKEVITKLPGADGIMITENKTIKFFQILQQGKWSAGWKDKNK